LRRTFLKKEDAVHFLSAAMIPMTRSKPLVRGLLVTFLLAGLLAGILAPMFASVQAAPQMQSVTHVVISQVYGGGGNNGATYKNDFVELFNPTNTSQSLAGWSIQYASATGTFSNVTNLTDPPTGPLGPGQYYLVQLGITGAGIYTLPTPDAIGTTNMNATAGQVILANTTTGLPCNGTSTPPPCSASDPSIIDLVGYGSVNFYEGSGTAPAPSNTTSDIRKVNGCYDTNNNNTDFATGTPVPRNTSSPVTICSVLLTATAIATNLTGTAASNLTTTASVANLTGTAVANLTATANSILTATASAINLTGTAASNLTPTATSTPCPTSYLSLLINEVGWMGTKASSSDEWVELYNPSACDINLSGWTLTDNGNVNISLSGTIQVGKYFLLGRYTSVFTDVTINQIFSGSLNNNGATLYLLDPSGSSVDTANAAGGYWPAGSAYPSYASMERFLISPSELYTDWRTFGGVPFGHDRNGNLVNGTPGRSNWALTLILTPTATPTITKTPTITRTPTVTGTLPTLTPTRRPTGIPPTPFAHVVINEFLPRAGFDWNNDGLIDVNDEFIEIENLGPINVNLSGWKLSDDPNIGGKTFVLPGQTLKPGQRAVYYGLTTHILLVDSGDTIRLTNPSGVIVDARGYGVVKYPDQSHCRIPDGDGYWQLACLPTPGNGNVLTGALPALPPAKINQPAPCLLPDTTPAEFRLAVCSPYGADIWNRKYWDDAAGQNQFVIPDPFSKGEIIVE